MRRTRVKICGITRVEDAVEAAEAGADAIGLVFHPPSKRHVTLEQARQIADALPPFVTRVGLFVDRDADTVRQTIAAVGLELLQFHGEEPADYCRAFDRPYLKAVRVRENTEWAVCEATYADAIGLLADTYLPGVAGGTGQCFDWRLLPLRRHLPLVLAGGLNANNVAEAIRLIKPWAVDVSGGVESAPGHKAPRALNDFVAAVQAADLA